MADVKLLVPFILKWEGGFVDDPDDRGGTTNRGVTIATYETYCKKKGRYKPSVSDLKALTEQEWTEIMKCMYWDRWKADDIRSQSVANILVDWVWASGTPGIKIPQKILGVADDGLVGRNTITTLNAYYSQAELFGHIKQARYEFIDRICKNRPENYKFINGWKNRLDALLFSD